MSRAGFPVGLSGQGRGSVETLHHPPAAGRRGTGVRYGEEKVQTPNRFRRTGKPPGRRFGAVKAVAGMNQQVVGSSPSAGSIRTGSCESGWPGGCHRQNARQSGDRFLEGFPSGQRGQTVNLLAQPSEVRILPPPPFPRSGRGEWGTRTSNAGVVQWLEPQPSKLMMWVRFPSPAPSALEHRPGVAELVNDAHIAQSVEHFLGKEEVTSSSLVMGSSNQVPVKRDRYLQSSEN